MHLIVIVVVALLCSSPKGLRSEVQASPPPSAGGAQCNGANCTAWVIVNVEKFEHVSAGVNDPPCAADPKEAVNSVGSAIVTGSIAIGAAIGGVPGAIAGGVIGGAIVTIGTPDTPLGKLLNPPSDKSRCGIVAVVIPVGAIRGKTSLWSDNLAATAGVPPAISLNPPVLPPLMEVSPNVDTTYSKFDGDVRETPLIKDGKPIGTLVWTVFKNWAGGRDRRAGLKVDYVQK